MELVPVAGTQVIRWLTGAHYAYALALQVMLEAHLEAKVVTNRALHLRVLALGLCRFLHPPASQAVPVLGMCGAQRTCGVC